MDYTDLLMSTERLKRQSDRETRKEFPSYTKASEDKACFVFRVCGNHKRYIVKDEN